MSRGLKYSWYKKSQIKESGRYIARLRSADLVKENDVTKYCLAKEFTRKPQEMTTERMMNFAIFL
jgi:hypothetical protein